MAVWAYGNSICCLVKSAIFEWYNVMDLKIWLAI